jgi:hypothetical protein
MRKLLLIVFGVCFWIVLLVAIVTTLARLNTEAKERRAHPTAAFPTGRDSHFPKALGPDLNVL